MADLWTAFASRAKLNGLFCVALARSRKCGSTDVSCSKALIMRTKSRILLDSRFKASITKPATPVGNDKYLVGCHEGKGVGNLDLESLPPVRFSQLVSATKRESLT